MRNKLLAAMTALAMLSSTSQINAYEYCTDGGGCGYAQCKRTSCLTPCIALGTIAIVAIVAVAIQNGSSSHSHSHSGSSSDGTR